MRILYGHAEDVAAFVAERIDYTDDMSADSFGLCEGIGVLNVDGKLIGGVVFHDYQKSFGTIQLSCAASTPRWMTYRLAREILAYPFRIGIQKIWTATLATNTRALRFNNNMGFRNEAVLEHEFGTGRHCIRGCMRLTDYESRYGVLNG